MSRQLTGLGIIVGLSCAIVGCVDDDYYYRDSPHHSRYSDRYYDSRPYGYDDRHYHDRDYDRDRHHNADRDRDRDRDNHRPPPSYSRPEPPPSKPPKPSKPPREDRPGLVIDAGPDCPAPCNPFSGDRNRRDSNR